MTEVPTPRRSTTEADVWDDSLEHDAEEDVTVSWVKCYRGGVKHREYRRADDAS